STSVSFIFRRFKMLTLKIKDTEVEPTYNYRLYKNIAGDDKDKRKENFYSFLDGLFSDDSITIINFFKAVAGKDLSEDEVVDQLDENGLFDDVHKTTDEIITGLATSGFLKSEIKAWKKYGDRLLESMKASLKLKSIKQEDKEMTQIQINQLEENKKNIESRMDLIK